MKTTEYKGITIQHGVQNSSDRFFVLAEGFNPDGYVSLSNAKGAITKAERAKFEAQVVEMGLVAGTYVPGDGCKTLAATNDDKDRASVEVPGGMVFGESNNVTPSVQVDEVEVQYVAEFGHYTATYEGKTVQLVAATFEEAKNEANRVEWQYVEEESATVEASAAAGWTTARNDKGDPIHGDPKMAAIYAGMDYCGMTKNRDTRSRNKREGKYMGKAPAITIAGRKIKPYHFRCRVS